MIKDRTEYYKQYYQAHKAKIKAGYISREQFVRWVDVKKALTGCHKQIGDANYDIIIERLNEIERKIVKEI